MHTISFPLRNRNSFLPIGIHTCDYDMISMIIHLNIIPQGYHRRCFKCVHCNRTLDSMMHCDGADKQICCRGIQSLLGFENASNSVPCAVTSSASILTSPRVLITQTQHVGLSLMFHCMSRRGTGSVTNAATARKGWTPPTVAPRPTKTFTAKVRCSTPLYTTQIYSNTTFN